MFKLRNSKVTLFSVLENNVPSRGSSSQPSNLRRYALSKPRELVLFLHIRSAIHDRHPTKKRSNGSSSHRRPAPAMLKDESIRIGLSPDSYSSVFDGQVNSSQSHRRRRRRRLSRFAQVQLDLAPVITAGLASPHPPCPVVGRGVPGPPVVTGIYSSAPALS